MHLVVLLAANDEIDAYGDDGVICDAIYYGDQSNSKYHLDVHQPEHLSMSLKLARHQLNSKMA